MLNLEESKKRDFILKIECLNYKEKRAILAYVFRVYAHTRVLV